MGTRRDAREQFGRLATQYGTSATHSTPGSLVDVGEYVAREERRFTTALDIGTGPGFTAFAIAPYCERVIATDVTSQMLDQVRNLRGERAAPNTEMALVAAEALPFQNDSIDLIVTRTASHHFVDLQRWLGEVRRVLTPGGVLLAADTCAPEDENVAAWMHEIEVKRDPSHGRNIPPSQWRAVVEAAGLTVTRIDMSYVSLWFPDWAERAGMSKDAMAELRDDLLEAPEAAKQTFAITDEANGRIDFHWDVVTVRAEKRSLASSHAP